MSSITTADLKNYAAYIETHSEDLLTKMRIGNPTGALVTNHQKVLGKINLTEFTVSALAKRWSETFDPVPNAISHSNRFLEPQWAKVDLEIIPSRYRDSYLQYMAAPENQQDPTQFPLLAWIMENVILPEITAHHENASWKAIKNAVPAAGDPLESLFDGYHKRITDAATANEISLVGTGAITNTNAVGSLEAMFSAYGSAYATTSSAIMMNPKTQYKLLQDYRERYGKFTRDEHGRPQLDISNVGDEFHALPGMKEGAILITKANNMHKALDRIIDKDVFSMQPDVRVLKLWNDFSLDTNFGMMNNDILVANDQH